jgi:hypothetical protein
MRFSLAVLLLVFCLSGSSWAHDIVLEDESGRPLVVLLLKPQWTAVAAREALELTSPDDRTRIHCLELSASADIEEGHVFLKTMRDTMFQTYEATANESTDLDGVPAILLRGRGMSRGFDTYMEALIFREPGGRICLVMLQQDVGYESTVTDLKSVVSLP